MPQHKSAIKRVRQISKRREHNRRLRSTMRTLYKKALAADNREEAEKSVREATSYIDRMVKVGILHKNNAANKKSNLARHLNTL
ncbi:MAG TPA: 30S ribosomal protein S20 [Balneolales bacterium]|nr:30S ribosomal protein S20 [Balneolales bacterium]